MEKTNPGQEKLEKIIEEYEKKFREFIDIAAHDLDSPLRKLNSFIERLLLKYKDQADEQTQLYVQRIQSLVSDMRSMIDDLTEFARANNASALNHSDCDLNDVIAAVKKELDPGDEAMVVSATGLPVVKGDNSQYRHLFKNLIENAAKFRKREGKAAINIRSEELAKDEQSHLKLPAGERYYKITVEDNGIGFDQQWAQKIFEPFVRLHGKSEFPGNGLGLAISKRIAENHKGIIYAESQKDIGSRFIVILPQTP